MVILGYGALNRVEASMKLIGVWLCPPCLEKSFWLLIGCRPIRVVNVFQLVFSVVMRNVLPLCVLPWSITVLKSPLRKMVSVVYMFKILVSLYVDDLGLCLYHCLNSR